MTVGLEDLGVVGSTLDGRPLRRVRCRACGRIYERTGYPSAIRLPRGCASCTRAPRVHSTASAPAASAGFFGRSAREYAAERGYRTVCISIYETELTMLDAKVDELREAGVRIDRSKFIRAAVSRLSVMEYLGR